MKQLIKNGDIIFDGVHTREELEKQAFAKLEKIEKLFAARKHRLTTKATYKVAEYENDEGEIVKEPDDIYNLMVALEDLFE